MNDSGNGSASDPEPFAFTGGQRLAALLVVLALTLLALCRAAA